MAHRSALPVDIELTLTGLDLASRNALHASIAANARRAFTRLGPAVKRVRVHVTRLLGQPQGEVWEVAVGVSLESDGVRRVHTRSSAGRPHVALEGALVNAWGETQVLLRAQPLPEPARVSA
jgi:hypothetical protein